MISYSNLNRLDASGSKLKATKIQYVSSIDNDKSENETSYKQQLVRGIKKYSTFVLLGGVCEVRPELTGIIIVFEVGDKVVTGER